eukprot:TRINITY_DN7126_c0_g1_i3.p1 TRINITY_DN7126_c0_g1~~TRINITY_DN7126_c0_g1_i3.p1  ORF type:complete len:353 (-),score=61.92 TRINITY_DN7126_c0_g1_i3:979-1923(-)
MNPGGSVKDRAALKIVQDLENKGVLVPRHLRKEGDVVGVLCEGTGGNTGLGLALVAAARGYRCVLTMPENVSQDKIDTARLYGAEVIVCPCVPFTNTDEHYFHKIQKIAEETPGGVWCNQFENLSNRNAHYEGTAPEIFKQLNGRIDGICLSAGTGGTIGGITDFMKSKDYSIQCYLIDPPGSALFNYIMHNELVSSEGNTITEGIGISRLTENFLSARIDGAFQGTDMEAVEMAYLLLHREGLLVGPSAALNIVGAVKLSRVLEPSSTIVTVVCDGGERYSNKLYDKHWLLERDLIPKMKNYDSEVPDLSFVL